MHDDQFEHIEAYINGELKGDALRAFEEAIAANTELAKQVSLYRSIEQENAQCSKWLFWRKGIEADAAAIE
jgi:anti-sigma factor RsiW